MTAVQRVIALAEAELGYREKATNACLDDRAANAGAGNWTKYARDLDAVPGFYNGKKNGFAWCEVFFDWLFVQCFGAERAMRMLYQPAGSAGAGCRDSAGYYQAHGAFTQNPAPGAQIFFSFRAGEVSHTGLVTAADGERVTTIEGNASDGVCRRVYDRGDARICGYGLPDYSLAEVPAVPEAAPAAAVCHPTLPLLKRGSKGHAVEALQVLLRHAGLSLGRWGVDGDFGADTESAVRAFQRGQGLAADGEVGADSYGALFGGSAANPQDPGAQPVDRN